MVRCQFSNPRSQNSPLNAVRSPSVELGHGEHSIASLFSKTSLLNVPLTTTPSRSVITDNGDQEELQHRRTQTQSSESSFSSTQSFADVELNPSPYELQGNILDAYQRTESEQSFLPKRELTRLITPEAVCIELANVPGSNLTTDQIESYAIEICAETTVQRKGKPKIKSFRKIFALLVIAEASSSIGQFIEDDVSDLDLPLIPIKALSIKGFHRKSSKNPLKCFKGWSPTKLRLFHDNQWQMLATFFSYSSGGDVKHYALHERHILPFVALEGKGEDDNDITGCYGRVFMVHIHKDHHNFPDVTSKACDRGFAIKQQLHPTDRKSYEKEANILKKFTGKNRHKHIVSLLATYEHLGRYHLVFHRAESNLLTFWNKLKRQPAFEYGNVMWMAEQCAGISEGLCRLHKQLTFTIQQGVAPAAQSFSPPASPIEDHPSKRVQFDSVSNQVLIPIREKNETEEQPSAHRDTSHRSRDITVNRKRSPSDANRIDDGLPKLFGRHGDIHPGNMLWFDSGHKKDGLLSGTLKIADFGQAEMNSILSRTKHRSVAHTVTYRPPECDQPNATIRQEYDMWCIGCVFLECVAWMLGGARLLTKFGKERISPDYFQNGMETDTFFQVIEPVTDNQDVKVKDKVVQFIDELHKHPNCTEFFHELLNTIKYDMLVVDSLERKPCNEISRRLKDMFKRCREDISYAATTNPWES
ncbi:uncharacterized protein EKO05_0001948 [Ascochyta rabiei]|uniref:uncharacterized protein n=1 Tax=Didymella rabiei TaxID=5454 RepID=UPI0022085BEC|nr:uncharacterized protein EKO05_0001948 [Ascochyta rabiei]UPX11341.1 hypothetical protein EKO05_0001948 [Ascochyta rabiei]